MKIEKLDTLDYILIATLLLLLTYAGFLSAKSIQWDVLQQMENKQLILPTPIISTPSAQTTP